MNGFINSFDKNDVVLTDICFNESFQFQLINNLWDIVLNLLTFRYLNYKNVLRLILIIISSFGNEIVNDCEASSVIVEGLLLYRRLFGNGFFIGIGRSIALIFTNTIENFRYVMKYAVLLPLSMLTLQGYYAGFSAGELTRILFYNQP